MRKCQEESLNVKTFWTWYCLMGSQMQMRHPNAFPRLMMILCRLWVSVTTSWDAKDMVQNFCQFFSACVYALSYHILLGLGCRMGLLLLLGLPDLTTIPPRWSTPMIVETLDRRYKRSSIFFWNTIVLAGNARIHYIHCCEMCKWLLSVICEGTNASEVLSCSLTCLDGTPTATPCWLLVEGLSFLWKWIS
jgi:hypothetical protein